MQNALELSGLVRTFGEVKALRGLDLTLKRGEFLGLLGPNGAGKTTCLRMVACLDQPDSGSLRVLGHDPLSERDQVLSRMGVVPQELALYDELTAQENLDFFAALYGLDAERRKVRVAWALESAGLQDRSKSKVGGFSGGMKRRLNLVAALMHEPELVLLDEPTVGVDPQSRNHLLQMIEGMRGSVSLVYTTHQMGEIERLCDRIAIMDQGRLVASGSMQELREMAREKTGAGERLQLHDGDQMQQALAVLEREGIACSSQAVGADLESIFLATTGKELRDGEA